MKNSLPQKAARFAEFILRRIAVNRARLSRVRNRHTRFIAVTGSSGKTTLCHLLDHVLSAAAPTAAEPFKNTMPGLAPFMQSVNSRHEFAIFEVGIGAAGRMAPMARLIRPHIAVLTMIRLEHKKTMPDLDLIAHEKGYLIEHLSPGGVAVLNADDEQTAGLARRANGRVVMFGRAADADYRAVDVSADFPDRLSLAVRHEQQTFRLRTQLVGAHFWLPVAAAFAVAHQLGIPTATIVERIASFEPVFGRCSVLSLPENRNFVLDTYKAPQHSLLQAFEMARTARATKRRIVLGQLADTTGGGRTAYRRAYRQARDCADEIIFVGHHAHRHNASRDDVESGRIVNFKEVREVSDYLRETAVPGEFVLLKSNCTLHLERAGLAQIEIVRCWGQICRLRTDCSRCGLYDRPYETHLGDSSARLA